MLTDTKPCLPRLTSTQRAALADAIAWADDNGRFNLVVGTRGRRRRPVYAWPLPTANALESRGIHFTSRVTEVVLASQRGLAVWLEAELARDDS